MAQSVLLLAVVVLGVGCHGDWSRAGVMISVSAGLFTLGGVFGVSGVIALGSNRAVYPRPLEHSTLIQHGIYARVRHPLYTSVMLVSLAWAGLWQSWSSLPAALALIPLLAAKAGREDVWLRDKFPG